MAILALKLTLTPFAVAGATLAARRFGPSVGGWLIGLPVTAGPVVLVLALEHGARFADGASLGLLAGVTAQAAFVLGYAAAARRGAGWPASLAAGSASFAAVGALLLAAHLDLGALAACGVAVLVFGLRVVPGAPPAAAAPPARLDLPLRIVLATGALLAITAFATTLGPGTSGLVTVYPLLSTTLAVFAHRREGAAAAVAVYRGLLAGLFALVGFAGVLALVLERVSLGDAYALALALTLAIEAASLRAVRPAGGLP